jgi:hypothetical protein
MCPPGGDIDEGIAREAFAYAAAEFATQDLPEIEELSVDQWKEFFNELVARSIELRVMADTARCTPLADSLCRPSRLSAALPYAPIVNEAPEGALERRIVVEFQSRKGRLPIKAKGALNCLE